MRELSLMEGEVRCDEIVVAELSSLLVYPGDPVHLGGVKARCDRDVVDRSRPQTWDVAGSQEVEWTQDVLECVANAPRGLRARDSLVEVPQEDQRHRRGLLAKKEAKTLQEVQVLLPRRSVSAPRLHVREGPRDADRDDANRAVWRVARGRDQAS